MPRRLKKPVPWTRPPPRRPPPPQKVRRSRPTPALFYGLPVSVIADWGRVSSEHARLLKTGIRPPSRQVERLVSLYRDGRVLDGKWRRWVCRKDKLVSPEGVEFDAAALDHHRLVVQFARELAARSGEAAYGRFWELLA